MKKILKPLNISMISCLLLLCTAVFGQNKDDIRLIIRGDDLGMTQGSMVAFEQAFNNGVLTCASLIVPAPWFEGAAEMISKNPGWCIGVHLALVGEWRGFRWRPVLPYDKVPSLVDEDGYFYKYPDELNAHNPNPDEVEAELRAQIELAKKRGVNISYLDNHYGAVQNCPGGKEILKKLSSDYNLPISSWVNEEQFGNDGIYYESVDQKKQRAVKLLKELEPGLWLWVCHPGIDSPEQNALIHSEQEEVFVDGCVGKHRAAVLETLTSIEVKSIILKRGIKLIDYRDLWKKD